MEKLVGEMVMTRPFSNVDYKTRQAEFFLSRIAAVESGFFATQCFTDAFVCAARSITFALQAVCSDIPGFSEWYSIHQNNLKADSLAEFFNRYRSASVHLGDTSVGGCTSSLHGDGKRRMVYSFRETSDIPNPPQEDAYAACRTYFASILRIVLGAYRSFACQIDDRWYFTSDNFQRLGKSIEEAEQELGFPRGWTRTEESMFLTERWRLLRTTQTIGCQVDLLFEQYLGEHFAGPDEDGRLATDSSLGRM